MKKLILLSALFLLSGLYVFAGKENNEDTKKDKEASSVLKGLKFRSIGPALKSGRIADFAVNPDNIKEYYVAVASGGIWKTSNAGNTFKPVFDKYGSYAIGCLAMDPNNHNIVWAGTGENNHQRSVSYGDGIYLTKDGGKTWKNMGLKDSRHIGRIIIHPGNSNIIYVAAEGSVWGPGGDRGLYKTTNQGETWERILFISENTGINDIQMDPRNPEVIYASSEQRRRHVFTRIGGGPETGIFKTEDGGQSWDTLTKYLPGDIRNVHMGGIGLAISPVNPDVIYAIIEAQYDKGGFFRSTDRGASWKRMSNHHSSGQYYNEIFCDPTDVDKVYSVETFTHITLDGGKTWKKMSNNKRHVDDHALWINPKDNDHFLIGGDGGVYESWDAGKNFQYKPNLPVTQFYRVAVDNSKPFYRVYGGTQDNNTLGGPSRNLSSRGVNSSEWITLIGGDGYFPVIDPADPNIVYCEYQYGNVYRFDKKSGEAIYIKPQPAKDELTHKWNWNTPLILSHHDHKRLYIAANKVFRSDDRGNSWKTLGDDLTAQTDRTTLPVMDKYWSADAVSRDVSTSLYGTIVAMAESRVRENLLYIGTDDGLIQVTEGEQNEWRKISEFPGIPPNTYVSDLLPSKFDKNIVFASFDNRKRDDFTAYILKSTDKGKTWTSVSGNLPANCPVHSIEQDFEDPELLFAGTEFGIYFSNNGGEKWTRLKNGIPTISVRDIVIQEEACDLVMATFGRGFYILDDYSPLRYFTDDVKTRDAWIFPVRKGLMYIEERESHENGSFDYYAKNPDYGVTFTYYLKEGIKTSAEKRRAGEKKLFSKGEPIPNPDWEELRSEKKEEKPYLIFTIYDEDDNTVNRLTSKANKGICRVTWNMRYPTVMPFEYGKGRKGFDPLKKRNDLMLVLPGKYKVDMAKSENGIITKLTEKIAFEIETLENTTLPAESREEMVAFQQDLSELARIALGTNAYTKELEQQLQLIRQSLLIAPGANNEMMMIARDIEKELDTIQFALHGHEAKASWEEIPPAELPMMKRLNTMIYTHIRSTSAITQTQHDSYKILMEEFEIIISKLENIALIRMEELDILMDASRVPWTPGRIPRFKR